MAPGRRVHVRLPGSVHAGGGDRVGVAAPAGRLDPARSCLAVAVGLHATPLRRLEAGPRGENRGDREDDRLEELEVVIESTAVGALLLCDLQIAEPVFGHDLGAHRRIRDCSGDRAVHAFAIGA